MNEKCRNRGSYRAPVQSFLVVLILAVPVAKSTETELKLSKFCRCHEETTFRSEDSFPDDVRAGCHGAPISDLAVERRPLLAIKFSAVPSLAR